MASGVTVSKSIVVPLKRGNKDPPSIPKRETLDVPIPLSGYSSDSSSTRVMMSLVSSSKPSTIVVLSFLLTVKKPSAQLSSLKSRVGIMPSTSHELIVVRQVAENPLCVGLLR